MKRKKFSFAFLCFFILLFLAGAVAFIVSIFTGNDTVGGIGYIGAVSSFFLAYFTVILSDMRENIEK